MDPADNTVALIHLIRAINQDRWVDYHTHQARKVRDTFIQCDLG